MKKLSKEFLDKPIFIDAEGKQPYRQTPNPELIQTPRTYLLNAFNMPVGGPDGRGVPITRERGKRLDAVEEALKQDEPVLEEVDFKFLATFIDEINITIRGVRRAVDAVIDSAETWKPEPKALVAPKAQTQ